MTTREPADNPIAVEHYGAKTVAVDGGHDWLAEHGVEVVLLDDADCVAMMSDFIDEGRWPSPTQRPACSRRPSSSRSRPARNCSVSSWPANSSMTWCRKGNSPGSIARHRSV